VEIVRESFLINTNMLNHAEMFQTVWWTQLWSTCKVFSWTGYSWEGDCWITSVLPLPQVQQLKTLKQKDTQHQMISSR